MSLAAPDWQLQPLAFGQHLLGVLGEARVRAYSLPEATLLLDEPLAQPNGIVEIAGGSLLASGRSVALRLDPNAKKAVQLPPIPTLAGTVLLPERRDSGFVWAVQPRSKLLLRQRLDLDRTRSYDRDLTLEEYDGGPITILRDGALFYRGQGGVRRSMPESRPRALTTSFEPWRLLPGRRVDQAWAIAKDGSVELWLVGERLLVQKRFAAGAAPFDADANPDYLALVVVDEPGDAPRRFRLLVYTHEGERILERGLPEGEPEVGEDWEAKAVADRHVALGDGDPFVAVGGPGGVTLFHLPEGTALSLP